MSQDLSVEERVAALRQAFDQSFARGLDEGKEEERDFVGFCFEREQFALPVGELAAVEKRRKLVRLPSAPRACCGLAGVRGKLVAVYDLAALLGFAAGQELRWLVVPRGAPGVAFGVARLEGYVRAPVSALLARPVGPGDLSVATLRHGSATLSVLSMQALLSGLSMPGDGVAP
jgi:chemotaxis signal transduction protein